MKIYSLSGPNKSGNIIDKTCFATPSLLNFRKKTSTKLTQPLVDIVRQRINLNYFL